MAGSPGRKRREASPPPAYSSLSDPEASSSMPPPYTGPAAAAERVPLLIRHQPILVVREPRNVIIRIGRGARMRETPACAVILLAAVLALASSIWLLVSVPYFSRSPWVPVLPTYNIAIIGAGPAGIAAAQHLRSSPTARAVRFNITIFESRPVIGGALALHGSREAFVFPKDDPRQDPITAEDIAGKALMWNNALFTQDSEKILGDKVEFIELGHEQVGYYDGAHSIASAARPYRKMPTTTWLSFIWAYGSSVWKAAGLAQDGTNLREAMLKAAPAADVRAILQALGVLQPAQQWAGATVAERGISARYAAEILDPQVRRAHGQQGLQDTTGLAAMLAAAQEDGANAYAAAGGDNMLERLQRVVRKTGAGVRTARRVVGLRHQQFDKEHAAWLVRHEPTHNNGRRGGQDASVEAFDKVILAAFDLEIQPESSDGRTYNLTAMYEPDMNAGSVSKGDDRAFSSVHVTFFTSDAKLSPWGGNDQALFLDAGNVEGMQEVALVREIISLHDGSLKTEYLYRVLSQSPVIQELHKYANITWSYHTKIENAYPILVPQSTFPLFKAPFVEGLWWTTLIQHAGSTVDLNWLAGKAVAEDLIKGVTQK